jgi:hypothetical protein
MSEDRTCSVSGCRRRHDARGFCSTHYKQARRHGQLERLDGKGSMEAFWERVTKTPGGCWVWNGNISPHGYGTHSPDVRRAHKIAWESVHGPVPDGLILDHVCHTQAVAQGTCPGGPTCLHRRCVNPDHLEPVVGAVNTMRGAGWAPANAAKTHCPQGHPYDAENTYYRNENGRRSCRPCRNEASRRYKARRQAIDRAREQA